MSKNRDADKNDQCSIRDKVQDDHRRLWANLRERLGRDSEKITLDSLKLLKAYSDVLSQITKTERVIWSLEERDMDTQDHDNFEIAEAMAQLTLPQGAGKVME